MWPDIFKYKLTLWHYMFAIWIQGISSSLKGQLPCVQTLSLATYFYDERK